MTPDRQALINCFELINPCSGGTFHAPSHVHNLGDAVTNSVRTPICRSS